MTTEGRPWLAPLLCDRPREKSTIKATQVGVTEMLLASKIAAAEMGRSIIYSMPNQQMRSQFVANRVNPILENVPHYRDLVNTARMNRRGKTAADSVILKEIGRHGVIKFIGSNTEQEAAEFPADELVIDEVDLSDQHIINNVLPQRLDASADPCIDRMSKPSVSGYGIDTHFENSDQREWFVPCNHCWSWQTLRWTENVVVEDEDGLYELRDRNWTRDCGRDLAPVCKSCGLPMDRDECNNRGEWVAAYPTSRPHHHGYRISRLMTPTPLQVLFQNFQDCKSEEQRQEFYNSKLGEAYTQPGAALTEAVLDACKDDYLMPHSSKGPCSMGVDVGDPDLHVRISRVEAGRRRVAEAIRRVSTWEHLGGLIRQYGVEACVIDIRPEGHKAREFQSEYPDIVWLCDFNVAEGVRGIQIDNRAGTIKVNRTEAVDAATTHINTDLNRLPRNAEALDDREFYKQMLAPKRVKKLDTHGRPRYVWDEGTKADHYRFADTYDDIASTLVRPLGASGTCRRV